MSAQNFRLHHGNGGFCPLIATKDRSTNLRCQLFRSQVYFASRENQWPFVILRGAFIIKIRIKSWSSLITSRRKEVVWSSMGEEHRLSDDSSEKHSSDTTRRQSSRQTRKINTIKSYVRRLSSLAITSLISMWLRNPERYEKQRLGPVFVGSVLRSSNFPLRWISHCLPKANLTKRASSVRH